VLSSPARNYYFFGAIRRSQTENTILNAPIIRARDKVYSRRPLWFAQEISQRNPAQRFRGHEEGKEKWGGEE
jgi:hypothetical protein